jgi:hypothetical protein
MEKKELWNIKGRERVAGGELMRRMKSDAWRRMAAMLIGVVWGNSLVSAANGKQKSQKGAECGQEAQKKHFGGCICAAVFR